MRYRSRLLVAVAFASLIAFTSVATKADTSASYAVSQTFKIGGAGGFDYATIDEKGERLYFPRSTHTLVIDAANGKTLADIPGGEHLHGTALAPEVGRGFITDGGGAAVIVFDLKTFEVLGKIAAADDADGIIYDPASAHVFVTCGDSDVVVPIAVNVDPKNGKAEAAIDLGGKPEFLVSDGQGKLYVNIADKAQIAVIDTKAMKIITKYATEPGEKPTGLSMDREKGRLYVGCRNKKMVVMDAKSGAILASLPIGSGVDATSFSGGVHGGIGWASCGDGTLFGIGEISPGKFEVVQMIKTAPGAKTMALDPISGKMYLPTADMNPATQPGGRPKAIPGTFKVLVVSKTGN